MALSVEEIEIALEAACVGNGLVNGMNEWTRSKNLLVGPAIISLHIPR
jgi:hypothetical protein